MLAEFKIRLEDAPAAVVRELAHAARLPRGVFLRQLVEASLADGRYPPAAPTGLPGPTEGAAAALAVLSPIASNLTQLDAHARAAGGVLAGEKFLAALSNWAVQARDLGAALRAARLDGAAAQLLVERLAEPGAQLNALAHRLNLAATAGEPHPSVTEWAAALQPLQAAFLSIEAAG